MGVNTWIITNYVFRGVTFVWLVSESGLAVRKAVKAEGARFWWPFWISLWGVIFLAALAADLWFFAPRA